MYIYYFPTITNWMTELISLKAKIRGVSNRFKCCCGNLLRQTKFHDLLTNDWAFV